MDTLGSLIDKLVTIRLKLYREHYPGKSEVNSQLKAQQAQLIKEINNYFASVKGLDVAVISQPKHKTY